MLRFLTTVVVVVMVLSPSVSRAQEDGAQLQLLVDSLQNIDNPAVQNALLQGMLSGLAGRRNVPAPKGWSELAAKLEESDDKGVRELAAQLSQIFGDKSAVAKALKQVRDAKAPLANRRRMLHALLNQKNEELVDVLPQLLEEPALRLDAIRGFAAIETPGAPTLLLKRYDDSPSEQQKAIIETLATRKSYAKALLNAIEAKRVARDDIPSHVARSLSFLLGDAFVKVFGEVRDLGQDRAATIQKYKKLITESALEKADAGKGRVVFNKTCASCHMLYGVGGKIGPDLTGSNRRNLDYLLLNSVDPSYDVPEGYRMVVIQTEDGRVLNGVVAEEDSQRVVLKTVQQPRVIVLKSDIEDRFVSPKSMMPERQLDEMKPEEVLNLIKYLQTIEQVEVAK